MKAHLCENCEGVVSYSSSFSYIGKLGQGWSQGMKLASYTACTGDHSVYVTAHVLVGECLN